ncbi:DUF2958 domain-containing protein [Cupriavidus pauculus]|uniref:DUF2958 domain-containing protein n=1 Tax=Cupriavidus pauculus TaxID=82633 RepID=A0A2N5C6R8_9BURK|nr:DUF2958 domain-containing protein [Cupriavidus pauculus]PLP97919.1 hypothetical protein CYJ10_24260 [Cupriavidus pauculus]
MEQSLITAAQRAQLIANGREARNRMVHDFHPVVRLYTPDARATWLLAAIDPNDEDLVYGLCDIGIGMPSLDRIKVSVLEALAGPCGRRVLNDRYFRPTRTLGEYTSLSQANGSIVE